MSDHLSPLSDESDIRPTVATTRGSRGIWIFLAGLVLAGAMLFQTLEARRAALTQPSTLRSNTNEEGFISAPPAPEISGDPQADADFGGARYALQRPRLQSPIQLTVTSKPKALPESTSPIRSYSQPKQAPLLDSAPNSGSVAFQSVPSGPRPGPSGETRYPGATGGTVDGPADQNNSRDRVQASRLKNPATTVPKGTVIQAVLETALDSTRAGFARAIVSRDVYAFDGGKVLIPRGSRLVGEYKSDVAAGQKRALIQWQRLIRPDGVLINLDSPAADPLGRAGVGGKVNTHFFERFAGSILQSTLNIGAQLATSRLSRDTYILAVPSSIPSVIGNQGEKIAPTLKVRQGSSVSVFVARDLDFTVVEP